ncbi:uncharacterized protein N0V96_011136 [Colletotrichum fioriniae]|uniref:uncharacterized protein n=1 Tax=Colletotrichum fioriniae TaxID=710243 RepID=UPI0032D9DDC2|nr:hypothetical protein N0V96_011136 [Colletotrichum fioriniae]
MALFDRKGSSGDCKGQAEQDEAAAVFILESGATLKNAIIGPAQAEGVHCRGPCTIENVWWEDVCEDAATFKGTGPRYVKGGGAKEASDKVFQHNGEGWLHIDGFYANKFGKFYRSCGNCSQQFQRHVNITNFVGIQGVVTIDRVFSPFARVPGPYWASLSRVWLAYHSYTGDLHIVTMRLHEVHGKVVRIAPSEVSISDLTSIKIIYGAGSKFRKSDFYSVWQGRRKFDIFPERDDRIHSAQRRLISRPYAMTSLKELEPYVDNAIQVFLAKLGDVIGEVTFSKRFGFMEVESDDGSFEQIETALRSAAWIGQVPWLYWIFDYLSPVIGTWMGIASRHGSLRKFAAREVAARQDRGSDHHDILTKLLAVHKEKPEKFDYSDLVSMANSNIFAGSDTTAISIRSIIYHLLKNPGAKRRLIEEVDEHWRQGKLSDPVTIAESEKMPYLQAAMYEGLRVHPAVGMTLPRVVPQGGYDIAGCHMPAGIVSSSPLDPELECALVEVGDLASIESKSSANSMA